VAPQAFSSNAPADAAAFAGICNRCFAKRSCPTSMASPIIPKMGTREIATIKSAEPLSPPARRLRLSNVGRQMVYRVTTSRLVIPAEERLSPYFVPKG
jgi:hypothetical protein